MNMYARVLASFCFLQPIGSSAQELMGSPTPNAPVSSPRLAEPSDWDSATPDGVSGKTIAKRLATPIADHGALPVRGLRDIEIYRAASPSVVMVTTDTGLGSGSYLGANRILTNAHVVGDKKKVGIIFKPQQEGAKVNPADILVGEVSRLDNIRDLAIVTITGAPASVRPLEFGTEAEIQIGADVHAIGHPTGEAWTYTRGLINQFRRDYEWKAAGNQHRADVIQTQTPINPGNSGGPLIAESGKILGVNSFKKQGEALNFAVSVGNVIDFLNTSSPTASGPTASSPQASRLPASASGCKPVKIFDGRNSTGNGQLVQIDSNCDGAADVSFVTPDDRSRPIQALIDGNYDGKIDIIVEDRDRDGRWDISFHDIDFDGAIDLVGHHPDGKIVATRFERYDQYSARQ
jgi:S1-C subfamily serine protease